MSRYGSILKIFRNKKIAYEKHFERYYAQAQEKFDSTRNEIGSDVELDEKEKSNDEMDTETIKAARARLQSRNSGRSKKNVTDSKKNMSTEKIVNSEPAAEKNDRKMSRKSIAALDKSKRDPTNFGGSNSMLSREASIFVPDKSEKPQWVEGSDNDDSSNISDDVIDDTTLSLFTDSLVQQTKPESFFTRFIRNFFGTNVLTETDLAPALENMKQKLLNKNVASDVADTLCNSVMVILKGQQKTSFTRVKTLVDASLKESIGRILTPGKSIDILRQVKEANDSGRVYSIVLMGINGVGKSTTLAKLAFYLKENGVSTLLAACDTFRSGAVEQLRVHANCLSVPLFEMGYAKDPSAVAQAALKLAKSDGHQCVLIDTAGRMQNNRPLMNALGRLVAECKPDLRIFVGEALVGNDGINQISMFNEALASNSDSSSSQSNHVDAIILSKFDTVDLKVGAALSITHNTGQPILFVGTGQKYSHLRKLNVDFVLKALFT